jgi:hypothetical protein
VLHDRLLRPGRSEANLDHVVVGPGGLFLVDAKNRAGRVTEWQGGLYQHTVRAGASTSTSLADEVAKVHGMAAYMSVESGAPVTPVLCLAGAQEADFGEPQQVRGVWVVPVSRLVTWLQTLRPVLDRESVQRTVTRAMTDFPSTTTHPELLAAMGQAATAASRARRSRALPGAGTQSRRQRARAASDGSHPPGAGEAGMRLLRGAALVALGLALLLVLPTVVATAVGWLSRAPLTPPGAATSATGPQSAPRNTLGASPPPPLSGQSAASPDAPACTRATRAEVTHILGRTVYPVAVITGCAWGTRLDDPSTVVVSITVSSGHASYDYPLETSARQRRVVYGTAYDPHFKPSTALWAATGVPLTYGAAPIAARSDIHVVISTATLSLTDDQGRVKALAIARAANS